MDVDEIIQTAAQLLETGEVDVAEGLCGVALALTPENPELLRVSGRIQLHRGHYSEAAQSLAKAASNGAGDAPTLASSVNIGAFNLGNALGAAVGAAVIGLGLGYEWLSAAAALMALAALALVALSLRKPALSPA